MQNPQKNLNEKKPMTVPPDVKEYEAPIKKMENEAGYREWLDRSKLVVPPGELNASQSSAQRARSEQDALIRHEINNLLQASREFEVRDFRVCVADCEVTVLGTVPNRSVMQLVTATIERAKGVKHLINHLRIVEEESEDSCVVATKGKAQSNEEHMSFMPDYSVKLLMASSEPPQY